MNGQNGYGFNPMFGNWQMPPSYPWNPMVPYTGNQQQQSQQNAQMQQTNQRQQGSMVNQSDGFDFIRVNSVDDIKGFYVPAYGHAWFMFQDEPIMAYKFANEMGIAETKFFKFFEFEPSSEDKQEQSDVNGSFASKEYVKTLEEQIAKIKSDLEEMKKVGVNSNVESIEQVHSAERNETS